MLRVRPVTHLHCCPLSQEGTEGTSSNTACDSEADMPGFPGSRAQKAASGMGMASAKAYLVSGASGRGDPRAARGTLNFSMWHTVLQTHSFQRIC